MQPTSAAEEAYASPEDWAACRAAIRTGSKSFYAASHLLPARVRDPAIALYAFCRSADDAVDEGTDGLGALRALEARLRAVYAGCPADRPEDRAFAATVVRFGIPQALPAALLQGLAWDAQGKSYETLEDVHAYAARVGASVGAMMTLLMGVRSREALARACDLGTAMQLTNIARDVGEDARLGRLYLPRTWMREAGLDPDALITRPRFSPALGHVVARLLTEAERLYDRALPGVALLPLSCRPGIAAARLVYRAIGRSVAASGHDSISQRTVVSGTEKLALVAQAAAMAPVVRAGRIAQAPALAANAFLVDTAALPQKPAVPFWRVDEQIGQICALFLALRDREHMARTADQA